MQVIIIILLVLAVLLVIFTLQNAITISINVFLWEISDAPLVVVLLVCLLIGYLIAVFYYYPKLWKLKREYQQMLKFNSELKELQELNKNKENERREKENHPEGMKLDADDNFENPFFYE